jgi:hypothetical protein
MKALANLMEPPRGTYVYEGFINMTPGDNITIYQDGEFKIAKVKGVFHLDSISTSIDLEIK